MDQCPPHDFRAAWQTDEKGVIYCRFCALILDLEPQRTGPPSEESVTITVTDKQT